MTDIKALLKQYEEVNAELNLLSEQFEELTGVEAVLKGGAHVY